MTMQIGLLGTGLPAVSASADGKTYTSGAGLKPGSTAVLYANGTQVATATVSGVGIAIWTLSSAAAAGAAMAYDGVLSGSAGTAPTPPVSPLVYRAAATGADPTNIRPLAQRPTGSTPD